MASTVEDSLEVLDKLFKADVDPARVAAFIVEPVQGEGGFYEVPRAFMTKHCAKSATSTASS